MKNTSNTHLNQKTIESNGLRMTIKIDEDPENPRNWDNLGKMICFHKKYNLGNQHSYGSIYDLYLYLLTESLGTKSKARKLLKHEKSHNEIIHQIEKKFVILPIYGHDHSELRIQTTPFVTSHHDFDSGMLGYIFASHKDVREALNYINVTQAARVKAEKILVEEVHEYSLYLSGEVYGYEIEDIKKNEVIELCYGIMAGSVEELHGLIKYYVGNEYAELAGAM